jgi:hypothetical protein
MLHCSNACPAWDYLLNFQAVAMQQGCPEAAAPG